MGFEHLGILVSATDPGTNSLWILRAAYNQTQEQPILSSFYIYIL